MTIIVGVGNSHTPAATTPSSTSGSGTPWTGTVTFGAVPAGLESGDLMTDNSARTYMVQSIDSGTDITVIANQAQGTAPDTGGNASFSRAFTTLASAEAAISTWAAAGDTYTIQCHSEGSMPLGSTSLVMNDTTLGTGGTFKITVADGEWHQGVPGAGFRIQANTAVTINLNVAAASCPNQIVERIEVLGYSNTENAVGILVSEDGASTQKTTVNACMVHGYSGTGAAKTQIGIAVGSLADNGTRVQNCAVWDVDQTTTSSYGMRTQGDGVVIDNCCVYNCTTVGMERGGGSVTFRNNACIGNGTDFTGGSTPTSTNNASGDTTAPDNGGLNPSQENAVATTEWTSPSTGDFTIKTSTSVKIKDNGTDLSGTFTDDITGATRTGTWDIGAFFDAAAGGTILPQMLQQGLYAGSAA